MQPTRYCSFCGRSEHETDVLLAGANDVFICAECVELCTQVVARRRAEAHDRSSGEPT